MIDRSGARRMAASLLAIACLAPLGAAGQNATWLAIPGSGDFGTATNWTPATVPTGTASFDTSNTTGISIATPTTVSGFTFNAGASAYNFQIANILTLTGTGIANNSSQTQSFVNNGAIVVNNAGSASFASNISGSGGLIKEGAGTLTLSGINAYTGATTMTAGTLQLGVGALNGNGALTVNGGIVDLNGNNQSVSALSGSGGAVSIGSAFLTVGQNIDTSYKGVISGNGFFTKGGDGTLILTGANTFSGLTQVAGGALQIGNGGTTGSIGSSTVILTTSLVVNRSNDITLANVLEGNGNLLKPGAGKLTLTGNNVSFGGVILNQVGILQIGDGITGSAGNANITNEGTLIFNLGTSVTGGEIRGSGNVIKTGSGTLTLTGNSAYSGGTTLIAGILQLNSNDALPTAGALTINGGTLALGANQTLGALQGIGGAVTLGFNTLTVNQNTDTSFAGVISGTGGLIKNGTGLLNLTGSNTYSGLTTVNGGTLAVNGSFASNVTVNSGGALGGDGTIFGNVTNSGTLAPGNSIGTLSVTGSFAQNGGVYKVEANSAGQADRLNVTGAAAVNGGTVQVLAQTGIYAPRTTYTILNATGGVSGAFSNVTSNFAFLTPTLSYDPNNVFLTLAMASNAFQSGAQTGNQVAVGRVLDQASPTASGDFATVLNAILLLNTAQGPAALNAISGQNYSGFSTASMASGVLFMNSLGQQMASTHGSSGGGTRVALAEACEITCDGDGNRVSPWSLWGNALAGVGSVAGNGNASALSYNLGGFSTGFDYRFDPRFLAGIALGFASGTQWVSGFSGRGTSDSYNAALYGSFTEGAVYVDALAGYGYGDNQMTRMIAIPGLQARNAQGRTGVNQFMGQIETGYRIGIHEPAAASVTPFVRLQGATATQNAFSENGAGSLNLNVAQQSTHSVRTVLGTELAGAVDAGWRDKLAMQFRLGWAHEYADTSRPVTASFAGAPTLGYTVFGAPQPRDGVVLGLAANTAIAEATQIYLRYDGEVGNGADNHVFSAGLRMSW